MKSTTVFAIKANLAAWIMTFLLAVIVGLPLASLLKNVVFAGFMGFMFTFFGTFIAIRVMVKHSPLTPADRADAIEKTWKLGAVVGIILLLVDAQDQLAKGLLWNVFSLLSLAVQVLAVKAASKL